MYQTVSFRVRGVVPTIMCNGQTADPLNPFARQMKKISSKKTKTEDDHLEMARVEWHASLYLDEKSRPCWPSENIESMMVAAAKKARKGTDAKAGVFVEKNAPIIFEGPKSAEGLWSHRTFGKNPFISRVPAVINRSRIMRTRPIFPEWSLEFDINFLLDMFDSSQIIDTVETAGRIIGLSDWRPKYGRFVIEKAEVKNDKETANPET
jgi:hypothetical protein